MNIRPVSSSSIHTLQPHPEPSCGGATAPMHAIGNVSLLGGSSTYTYTPCFCDKIFGKEKTHKRQVRWKFSRLRLHTKLVAHNEPEKVL